MRRWPADGEAKGQIPMRFGEFALHTGKPNTVGPTCSSFCAASIGKAVYWHITRHIAFKFRWDNEAGYMYCSKSGKAWVSGHHRSQWLEMRGHNDKAFHSGRQFSNLRAIHCTSHKLRRTHGMQLWQAICANTRLRTPQTDLALALQLKGRDCLETTGIMWDSGSKAF